MATNLSTQMTEAELLLFYLGMRLEKGGRKEPVDKLLADFAEYRRELDQFRATLREAEAQCDRGEARPLDLDDIFARADRILDEEGIPE
jgi:hypothetical protein